MKMHGLTLAIERNVSAALEEDVSTGDLTAGLIPAAEIATARIITRADITVCGTAWADACFRRLDALMKIEWSCADGTPLEAGQTLCTLSGSARALLTGERTALNFLQLLSGIATTTRRYVDAVEGTRAKILDTRKTLPGLRVAQKYAVHSGGGTNHRMGLYDAILIKENHIAAAGGVAAAMKTALAAAPAGVWIQVEVETLDQLQIALDAGAGLILLDNMDTAQMRAAVAYTAGRAELEASGGITLDNVRQIAETGVDRISIGSLTKDVRAADLSMRFNEQ
ncbi:MAG: carboxylating nicotinate-nucleotide diphosphorylase [Betaproteobacteria bacterium]